MIRSAALTRRHLGTLIGAGAVSLAVPQLAHAAFPQETDIKGELSPLSFNMVRSSDGKRVTAADYRGKVVVLYFGFTRCPDVCPLTMHNMATILKRMGPLAKQTRVLFTTIDLTYDTLPRLKHYLANFGPPPEIDGLRGTPEELTKLAKQYHFGYHAPSAPNAPDPVSKISHTSWVYVFGPKGQSRYLLGNIARPDLNFAATTDGFDRLAREAARES